MSTVPTVDVVNHSTVYSDTQVTALVFALRHQVAYDFKPHWGQGCRLIQSKSIGPNSWGMGIFDDADQAGALGYHYLTPHGWPLAKVFARTTQLDGGKVSVTASHELLEMLADPFIDRVVQVGSRTFYALEVADACEADQYAYEIQDIAVSDFVLPAWFHTGQTLPGKKDFMGHISNSLELLPGGYIGAWTPSTGWTQKFADTGPNPASRRLPLRHDLWAPEA